ncbi:hypothetical protein [Algibacter mikhailovii]|uniref:hypothetical protein n=1 Tax=Algibacter mikhailovii TaxID=425498 RepID=UPI002494CC93|nr:hypothetical protein [Algibacter mikhailovii]
MEFKILAGIIIAVFVLFGLFRILKTKPVSKEITKEYNWKTDKEKFKTEFIQLMTKRPILNYLVIDFAEYYLQYQGWNNGTEFYCETVSNTFLESTYQLNDLQIKKLNNLNFSNPNTKDSEGNASPNYSKLYKSNNDPDRIKIFNELIFIMSDIYNLDSNEILKIRYE